MPVSVDHAWDNHAISDVNDFGVSGQSSEFLRLADSLNDAVLDQDSALGNVANGVIQSRHVSTSEKIFARHDDEGIKIGGIGNPRKKITKV